MPNVLMHILDYKVVVANYKLNADFVASEEDTIELFPEFYHSIDKISRDICDVYLGVNINSSANHNIPFDIETNIVGRFEVKDWEKEDRRILIEKNAVAILFPYLRALITSMTASANMDPYIIPVMNINALFEEQEKLKK